MTKTRHIKYVKEAIYPDDIEAAAMTSDEEIRQLRQAVIEGRTQTDSMLREEMVEGEMLQPPNENDDLAVTIRKRSSTPKHAHRRTHGKKAA